MSTTALQQIAAAANWHLRVNENFVSVSPSALYSLNPATTTGLTWGYLGGNFNGVSVANGTVALTASNTNYVVAHRTTGVVTAATTTTNWLNTAVYLQLYQIVAGVSTVTSSDDKRQAFGAASASSTVSGADKQIQYNASGAFGAEAGFEYDYSTNTLTVDKITLNGLLLTLASTTGGAGLRLPPGAAPTSPTNGDVWTTTAGMYARINGTTVGPFASAAGGATWGTITGTLSSQTDLQAALDAKGAAGIPQNSQSTAYTCVLADANTHILHPSADTTARTMTIPANSSVAYPIGTALTFVNQNAAGVMTIAITTDTMRLAGAGTTGSRTLAANGIATALKITSTEWLISGSALT
jgi:hypothetical protein